MSTDRLGYDADETVRLAKRLPPELLRQAIETAQAQTEVVPDQKKYIYSDFTEKIAVSKITKEKRKGERASSKRDRSSATVLGFRWSRRAFTLLLLGAAGFLGKEEYERALALGETNGTEVAPAISRDVQRERIKAQRALVEIVQDAEIWGKGHSYRNTLDGKSYILTSGYTVAGVGQYLQTALEIARTPEQVKEAVQNIQTTMVHLRQLKANYGDRTVYDQVHASDVKLLEYHGLQDRQVIVVSLAEQAMRIYEKKQLVRAMLVTTGRVERPTLPGIWSMSERRRDSIFQAPDPMDSPYWFPDTAIKYAMCYHRGGFYIHDAPWRGTYGAGTQFPHQDVLGTDQHNGNGSIGCVNLVVEDAEWVYQHTDWKTAIVIY